MRRVCSLLRLLQARGVRGCFSCVVEMVLQGLGAHAGSLRQEEWEVGFAGKRGAEVRQNC